MVKKHSHQHDDAGFVSESYQSPLKQLIHILHFLQHIVFYENHIGPSFLDKLCVSKLFVCTEGDQYMVQQQIHQHHFVTVETSFLECYQKFSTSNHHATHIAETHINFTNLA